MIAYVLGVTLLAALPANAQEGSWAGWHGCWRAVDDASAGRVVCLVPGSGAGEAVLNVIENGAISERTTVRTNGQPYAVEQGGCRGMETGQWSRDGRRIYVRAELDCEGVKRTSASVLAMMAGNEWVDVQTISIHGQHAARIVRYRPATLAGMPAEIVAAIDESRALARESARLHASAPLELADVIEATTLLPAEGVQALVAARNSGFGINAKKLAELEAARVPQSVIDVMIAVSYPKSFVLADNRVEPRPTTPQRGVSGYGYDRWDSCYDMQRRGSWYYSPFGRFGYYDDCYSPYYNRYGWGSRYGYGYNYGGYGWNTGPVVVIVRPYEDGQVTRSGSVIKGGGYTRGSSTSTTGSARTRDTSGAGSTSTTSSGTSSGGSSSGTSSGTSAGGRTAIPRGSGGGGGS